MKTLILLILTLGITFNTNANPLDMLFGLSGEKEETSAVRKPQSQEPKTLVLDSYDFHVLAGTALLEAGSKCEEDALDVTHAIINRLNDQRWPSSIHKVVFQPGQFAAVDHVSPRQISSPGGIIKTLQNLRGHTYQQAKAIFEKFKASLAQVTKMKNSRDHVDGLVYFKGESQYRYRHGSDPLRKSGCNFFHPDYGDSNQARDDRISKAPLKIISG